MKQSGTSANDNSKSWKQSLLSPVLRLRVHPDLRGVGTLPGRCSVQFIPPKLSNGRQGRSGIVAPNCRALQSHFNSRNTQIPFKGDIQ
jgi:hypothetical protein